MPESTRPARPFQAALRRLLGALAASLAGALGAGAVSGFARAPADHVGGAAREAALFAPLGVLIALLVVPAALLLSRARTRAIADALTADERRARALATSLIVAPPAVVLGIGLAARAGRFFMTAFHHVGLASLAQAVGLTLLAALVALLAAGLRRAIDRVLPTPLAARHFVAPSAALGLALALALLALGVATGSDQGTGPLLGAFGVLKKPELDLAPVWGLLGALALASVVALGACRSAIAGACLLLASSAGSVVLLQHVAHHFADSPSASAIDARPGLARVVLRALRRRSDRDHDHHAALYGGGDCNDRDPRINPGARDVPGNGIDEDCSGLDAPPPPAPPAPPPASLGERLHRETPAELSLLLITVDTLRWDTHYAGNPREVSPTLDRLAARSVVWDHAYALSSYTGRAVAPLLAGRYPTELARDGEHFTRYFDSNVLLAERLLGAGFATMGVASHFYFERHYGLTQGVTTWDLSPRPSSEHQEDTSNDARVADRAIAMLSDAANTSHRFMLWMHLFDPHKMYVPHPEFAAFGSSERARYDAEVAWSDRQIGRVLDALAAQHLDQRTVVVVTADHGEAFGEHGMGYHGVELWDELVRVPLIVYAPGLTPSHVAVPRSQIDLVPTLLELLRLPAPAPGAPDALSGISLVPDLLGAPAPARPIYIELPEGPYNSLRRSLVFDGWKLTQRETRFELYHLATDPGERQNVAGTEREQLARMRTLMEQVRGSLHEVAATGG